MRDIPTEDGIPWFLIAKQALRGISVQTLSTRFNVPADQIRRHLDKAIAIDPLGTARVRTNAEINEASARARNDLVSILQEAIDELSVSPHPRLKQLRELERLLASAARLFQWPTVTATRVVASVQPINGYGSNGQPTEAVNLSLIATSPEKLAAMARAQEKLPEAP